MLFAGTLPEAPCRFKMLLRSSSWAAGHGPPTVAPAGLFVGPRGNSLRFRAGFLAQAQPVSGNVTAREVAARWMPRPNHRVRAAGGIEAGPTRRTRPAIP